MEATLKQTQTTTTTGAEEEKQLAEAMRELSSFELSLVGGGQGAAAFI